MKTTNNFSELVTTASLELKERGSSSGLIECFNWTCGALGRFCAEHHIEIYDESIGEQFLDSCRSGKTPASNHTMKRYCRDIRRLNCALSHIVWSPATTGRKPVKYASSCYDEIVEKYEIYLYKSRKTKKDVRRRVHIVSNFLKFAEQRNCLTLNDLLATDIYAAFEDSSDKGNFRRLVGAFLKYAYKYKLTGSNLYLVVPSVVRHKAVPSVYSPIEVEQLLHSIDRTTGIGKRDYSIILISARLGMRASDIAGMTFSCLDETKSTVRIVQAKTKKPLTLTLPDDVRVALDEYINEARPESEDVRIFLNVDGLKPISPASIGKAVTRAFIRSGIDCGKRRRGSHSLRASLATALLDEGNDYATIQQVLGQSDIQSTKSYVKANVEKLRINAIPVPSPVGNFMNLISGGGVQ